MGFVTLEITLISAKDIKNVNIVGKMDVYVVASLSDNPNNKQKTHIDQDGGTKPTWNFTMRFTVDERSNLALIFKIKHDSFGPDKDIGEVHVPVSELVNGFKGKKDPQYLAYQVRRPSGRGQGQLNLSYKVIESQEAGGFKGNQYPAQTCQSSSSYSQPPAAYPPPPQGGYTHAAYPPPAGYPQAQPSPPPAGYPKADQPPPPPAGYPQSQPPPAGYPAGPPPAGYPQSQPPPAGYPAGPPPAGYPIQGSSAVPPYQGYGNPPQGYPAAAPYGAYPPPQQGYGGYGYPPQPAGYPPAGGQYYQQPQKPQKPKKNSGVGGAGLGLGAGLIGGAVGGLILGEMVEDIFD